MGIPRRQIRWNGWGWTAHQDSRSEQEALWRWLAGEVGMPALLATPPRALEEIALPIPKLSPEQIAAFVAVLGPDRVTQDAYERAFHARGRSYHDLLRLRAGDLSSAPDAVLYPRGEDEVLAVLQLAAREKISVVPFGGGTSMVGGVTARPGSVTIDLSGMDQLLAVDSQAGSATAEAGIYGPALEKALAAKGMTLGHFPQSFEFSTLGGWIAASGAGQEAARHGRAADWLKGLRLVTAHGILDTQDFPASATGPDLKRIALGSEGQFGIITRATISVRPAAAMTARAFLFRDFASGTAATRESVRAEIPCSMRRLLDGEETRVMEILANLQKPRGLIQRIKDAWLAARHFESGRAFLIASFPDTRSAQRFSALAKKHGAIALGEGPAKHWLEERFMTPYRRDPLLDRGVGVEIMETSASWSSLPALYAATRSALDRAMRDHSPRPGAHGMVLCHVSHAYADGASLCFTVLFPRQLENEISQGQAIRHAGVETILAHGGTISHHHGVGEDNLAWMEKEKGAIGIAALRGLKAALDPENILNPGKLIPPAV